MDPDKAIASLQSSADDLRVRAELDDFARRVARTVRRADIPLACCRQPEGEVFRQVTSGMTSTQRGDVAKAWIYLRSAQQLSAQIRKQSARASAEVMQQRQTQGLVLK